MRISMLALAILATAACKKDYDDAVQADRSQIAISPQLTVRTDAIGDGGAQATFVLVDATNRGPAEILVVLGGALTDAHGAVVGQLRRDELRIPPGGRRTFALVDDRIAPRPTATGAKIEIERAILPHDPAPMHVTDGHVYADQGRAIVSGYVVNDSPHAGKAIVIGGFYDADGKPMTRPYQVIDIGAGARLPAQFVGPPGSKSATLFVGETAY